MDTPTSSSEPGAMPTSDQPATGTPTHQSAMPEKSATTPTLEETAARITELEHALKNATEERDRHRKKLSSYEETERKAQEATLSEIERTTKRATEAEERSKHYQQRLIATSVKLAAQSMGIIDPEMAALAIANDLEYGEDGMPTNVDKALEKLMKNKPYLAPPAQSQQAQAPTEQNHKASGGAPAVPAMNPGRSTIVPPGSTSPSRIPRLSDPGVLVPPGTVSRYQP